MVFKSKKNKLKRLTPTVKKQSEKGHVPMLPPPTIARPKRLAQYRDLNIGYHDTCNFHFYARPGFYW